MRGAGLWAVAGVVVLAAGCADRERPTVADSLLMFVGDTDFQRVPVHASRTFKVSLQNVGRSHLNVLDVWIEDEEGAYHAVFDHPGPHQIMPGEGCAVDIRFRPRRPGALPAFFAVRSDSKEEPVMRVPLEGEGVDAAARIPQTRLDFGRIEIGSEKIRTLELENPTDLPLKITPRGLGAHRDEFHTEPVVLQPGERRELAVAFRPTTEGRKDAALAVNPCEGCVDHMVMLLGEGLDKALVAEPTPLDFGQVPMDRDLVLPLTVRNLSTEPQELRTVALSEDTNPSFTHTDGTTPTTLQGGEERVFSFRYSPGHMGAAEGAVVFTTGSARNPEIDVPMFGFGGAAEICVSPLEHRFTAKPVGARVSVTVTVKNCGSSNSAPLVLTEIAAGASATGVGGEDQFSVSDVTLPRELRAGEELTFRVYFEPTREGEHATGVSIRTQGIQATLARVEVSGRATAHPPCQLEITPEVVDFGTALPGEEVILAIKIHNVGADVCPVKNIAIHDSAGGLFTMPGGALPGVIVHASYYFSFMVQFRAPTSPGMFSGSVRIQQQNPAQPQVLVPLVANAQSSCLVATPTYLDFGISRPQCPPPPRSATLTNQCSTPVQLNSVTIGAGTTAGQFRIDSQPSPLPRLLGPGDTAQVGLSHTPTETGMNVSPLYLGVDGLTRPLLVSLIGELTATGQRTDRFVQQDGNKVDVLFVVDNTASMVEEHPRLVSAIPAFVSAAQGAGVDLNIAVTTTGIDPVSSACPGGAKGGEAGRLFPVDNSAPRILTLSTSNLVARLQSNVQVGQCAQVEQGLEALRRALTAPLVNSADDPRTALPSDGNAGFLRDEAALAVVFVGDEDDHSPDSVEDYVHWLRSLKGQGQPQRSALYAIAPTASSCSTAGGTGTRYAEAAARTGGDVLSVCASDYSPLLQQVANKAFSPQDAFPLSGTPEVGSLAVTVNGQPQSSGWSYDAGLNQVVFSPRPAAGAVIDVSYRPVCN
jgi:hypothetical protein